jgi:DNA-directed RNA polymerase subunit omega
MIEALKSDDLANKLGGRFKLCTLIQRRLEQLIEGARPLVEREGRTDLELVIEEILQDKITLEFVGGEPEGIAGAREESDALL